MNYCESCENYVCGDECCDCDGSDNNHDYYVPKKRETNGDRIRSMTDEELAEMFLERDLLCCEETSKVAGFTYTYDKEKCLEDIVNWLEMEAEP